MGDEEVQSDLGRKLEGARFRMTHRPIWRAAAIVIVLIAVATLLRWRNVAPAVSDAGGRPSATPSGETYFVGADGTVTPIDRTQTPVEPDPTSSPDPTSPPDPISSGGASGTVPQEAFIDTSVVGQFREPSGARDHNNWKICGAGAMRILLAFVGKNPQWAVAYQTTSTGAKELLHMWPKMVYKDAFSLPRKQPYSFAGGVDNKGQGYMLYIAYGVHPPDWPRDRVGMWDGVSERGYKLVEVANWEYAGEPSYTPTSPFTEGSPNSSFKTFDSSVKSQISMKRVPVVVSIMTGSNPPDGNGKVGIPPWKAKSCTVPQLTIGMPCTGQWVAYKDVPDWVVIVGYDKNYYYYLCTCWSAPERCRYGAKTQVVNYPGSTHPYTWRVDKATFYWELTRQTVGGWLIYSGPPSDRVTGY